MANLARHDQYGDEQTRPLMSCSGLFLSALVAVCLGAGSYGFVASLPDQYRAQSKILLLSPQERYLPQESDNASFPEGRPSDRLADARSMFASPELLLPLIDDHRLLQNSDFSKRHLASYLRSPFLSLTPTETALANLQSSMMVQFHPERRLLDVSFHAPSAELAAMIANDLANGYMSQLKSERNTVTVQAISKLQQDIDGLEAQVGRTSEELTKQKILVAQQAEASREGDQEQENLLPTMEAKYRSQSAMLDHMRSKLQEALTRQSLDLTPPEARILSRATTPMRPVDRKPIVWGIAMGFAGWAMTFLTGISVRLRRARKSSVAAMPLPALPFELECDTSAPSNATDEAETAVETGEDPASHPLDNQDRILANETPSRAMIPDPTIDRHQRIVLMSDQPEWGGYAYSLAKRFAMQDLSVITLTLAAEWSMDRAGLTDILDRRATCDQTVLREGANIFSMGLGSRALEHCEFFDPDFHSILIALENSFDVLLIDVGDYFDNEFALKSLGLARDVQALIYAPETSDELAAQVKGTMRLFGYHTCEVYAHSGGDARISDANRTVRAA